MCDENETNEKEKTTEAKILSNRHEELRRWFESIGDCV